MPANLSLTATAGINCPKTAGVKELFIIPTGDVESITLGSNHDITDIVFDTVGTGFGKINFKRGECEVTEAFERMNEVSVVFSLPNPTALQRKELQAIKGSCELYAVARLYDRDELLFIGYDAIAQEEGFLTNSTSASTTGKLKTDDNFTTPTLVAEQGEYIRVLSGISGATVPATTTPAMVAELIAATSV